MDPSNGAIAIAAAWFNTTTSHPHPKITLAHMTFYWGTHAEVLFSGWPGTRPAMYALALVFVFSLAVLVEWLSQCDLIKSEASRVASGFFRAGIHAVRAGLSYMVMLAVMSFNGGVFLAAVLGHAVGFVFFGSGIFKDDSGKLPR